MTSIESIKSVLANYANFSGRAIRSEYWWFALYNFAVQIALIVISGVLNSSLLVIVYAVFALAMFVPSLAVSTRRLHDTNRSGWWFLLSIVPLGFIVLIVFFATRGTVGPNRFGPESSPTRLATKTPQDALNHAD